MVEFVLTVLQFRSFIFYVVFSTLLFLLFFVICFFYYLFCLFICLIFCFIGMPIENQFVFNYPFKSSAFHDFNYGNVVQFAKYRIQFCGIIKTNKKVLNKCKLVNINKNKSSLDKSIRIIICFMLLLKGGVAESYLILPVQHTLLNTVSFLQ